MKKRIVSLFLLLMLSICNYAWDIVPFAVGIDDTTPIGHGYPKSPVQPPKVYIEDYALMFATNHPTYVLVVKDENDDVVFSTTVYSTQTQVYLPATLSGTFELDLYNGGQYYFYSEIEL